VQVYAVHGFSDRQCTIFRVRTIYWNRHMCHLLLCFLHSPNLLTMRYVLWLIVLLLNECESYIAVEGLVLTNGLCWMMTLVIVYIKFLFLMLFTLCLHSGIHALCAVWYCAFRGVFSVAIAPCGPRSYRIRPVPFPGQRLYTATKLGFRFLCLFCVVVFSCSGWMFAFVVFGLVSSVLAKRLPGKNVSEMTYFVWNGT